MTHGEYVASREKESEARKASMPVWVVKWKSDGKYLASDRRNWWTSNRREAFRFATKTNADAARRGLGATDFYAKSVKVVRKTK
jgi:hypothetical protein